MCDDHNNESKGPITILELAIYRGAKENPDGSMSMGEIERVGLPFMGGCKRCGATIAAYNACPTVTDYIACQNGCVDNRGGYATVEEANRAMFPEEYEWQGVGHQASDLQFKGEKGDDHDG